MLKFFFYIIVICVGFGIMFGVETLARTLGLLSGIRICLEFDVDLKIMQ